jgi:hypothetical protein
MNLPAHNLTNPDNMKQVELMHAEILKRFKMGDTLPLLHPIDDMEIEDK